MHPIKYTTQKPQPLIVKCVLNIYVAENAIDGGSFLEMTKADIKSLASKPGVDRYLYDVYSCMHAGVKMVL